MSELEQVKKVKLLSAQIGTEVEGTINHLLAKGWKLLHIGESSHSEETGGASIIYTLGWTKFEEPDIGKRGLNHVEVG
ncbi:MAG: hypothetical protein ACE5GD_03275 [Candidatus Geothermarchaeales archaeon]